MNSYYEYPFVVNENLLGYANPKYATPQHVGHTGAARGGPWSFVGVKNGDGTGVLFHINSDMNNPDKPLILRGLNIFISKDTYHNNIWRAGKTFNIKGELYSRAETSGQYWFDDLQNGLAAITSTLTVEIDSTIANSWLFIPFDGNELLFPPFVEEMEMYYLLVRANIPAAEPGQDFRWFPNADKYSHSSVGAMWTFLDIWNYPIPQALEANLSLQFVIDPYEYINQTPSGNLELSIYYKNASKNFANGAEIEFYKSAANGETAVKETVFKTVENAPLIFENLKYGNYSYKVSYEGETDTISGVFNVCIDQPSVKQNIWIDSFLGLNFIIEGDKNPLKKEEIPFVNQTVQVYPNPAKHYITVTSENPEKITVSNILGQTVLEINNPFSNQTISVNNLQTGVYFVTVKSKDVDNPTVRFVKTE